MASANVPSTNRLNTPFSVGGLTIFNRILLAPMSGVTDLPFRQRAERAGIGLTVAEMVASGELERERSESMRRIRHSGSGLRAVQLVGRDPETVGKAAQWLAENGVQIIDINMGCPAKKVTGGACGAALMTEPDRALRIVESAVASAGESVVTVKMRLGWDRTSINAPELARHLVDAGARMITVHGRTREQRYTGTIDPDAIAKVRAAVPDVAFIANGDVSNAQEAEQLMRRTGADGIMIGRAHYGQPFLAASILGNGCAPAKTDLRDYIIEHYEAMLEEYDVQRGSRHARKHLGWYLDRFLPDSDAAQRQSIMTAREPSQVIGLLTEAFGAQSFQEAA
ncbi:tRNA-dihydrouridine synthase [Notoacmeibacter sp. MSK16QG-6]|uniref:tRNA dihydrouridine synthase n=1 Tax=Notoacmeibacter sp. MSK16QG-6 TaxID=2957982 RepID=UPI00209E758C|nr:tRNA-dihydrouridine synthase [Notoacmeibacter sp. MSK16QG-6]MCP1200760.1 tRNA-dihydrouridine synthase [Notoacmeibacter sp. MSK16QG-6]